MKFLPTLIKLQRVLARAVFCLIGLSVFGLAFNWSMMNDANLHVIFQLSMKLSLLYLLLNEAVVTIIRRWERRNRGTTDTR